MRKLLFCSLCIIVVIVSVVFTKTETYYPNVKTGITAQWVESSGSRKYNFLSVGENLLVAPQSGNLTFSASDQATIKDAYANFGDKNSYTLYTVESSLAFTVYTDNKNRVIFCESANEEAFLEYYTNYDNYTFKTSIIDTEELSFKQGFMNQIVIKYSNKDQTQGIQLSDNDVEMIEFIPISNDRLIEGFPLNFFIYNNEVYFDIGYACGVKLEAEESMYILSHLN